MQLVCLLPVRNGAVDLPGYLESARRFVDGIVALDDGSTDGTLAILESDPLVVDILENPRRADYRGWDDSANRNRLLTAAEQHQPEWIISLDADERIDATDARALREFVESDALPGVAYSFRWYTMVGDLAYALPEPIWVHRLFAFRPGQRFPCKRLHFAPVPTEIPRRAYLRTTFRIQHLAGLSAERRMARFEKYREADPAMEFDYDYAQLLATPGNPDLMAWEPRPAGMPALFTGSDSELMPDSRTEERNNPGFERRRAL
jgi:glycosyltransferase involved in cell wall biosynthesis